jgi:hypothetical protein
MQAQLIQKMTALRLRGMASALPESLTALSQNKLAPTGWLGAPCAAAHESAGHRAR